MHQGGGVRGLILHNIEEGEDDQRRVGTRSLEGI